MFKIIMPDVSCSAVYEPISTVVNVVTIEVVLPEGKTNAEILEIAKAELTAEKNCYFFGNVIRITGRITTHLAMWLAHQLGHICKSMQLFDPKTNQFIQVFSH